MARTREQDAERKREASKASKDVTVPACENPRRRKRLEKDDEAWLLWYFAPQSETTAPFTYKFKQPQKEMIAAIAAAITNGEDKSIAAPRGEGKTTLAERLLLKYTLQGKIRFSVLFAATGGAAQDCLESIKQELETNVRLMADYPEVCAPVAALENTPNRAHYQTVSGKRHDTGKVYTREPSRFSWCGQEIFFPNVPGSPSAGSIIATRGLDAAVRGVRKKGRRPDVAVIDDPDTEDTARSEEQAAKLETRIDRAIAGLGGQTRSVARVMLTTLQSRISVSYKYTDPKQKPSWRGQRFRFLVTPPDRIDLWEQYITLQKTDWGDETSHAHEFYIANRDAMDAGAVVSNSNRYVTGELSALQHYYNLVARLGQDAVDTEWQNDPPESTGPTESGITPQLIQRKTNGFARGIIPPGCTVLSHTSDVGKTKGFHWVVRAWMPDGTGFTIDYGRQTVYDTIYGSDEGLDAAIHAAVIRRMQEFRDMNYAGGAEIETISLFDARYRTDAVLSAVAQCGLGVYGYFGIGKSAGCVPGTFRELTAVSATRRKLNCQGAYLERKGNNWAVMGNADQWKAYEHDRWMSAADRPGCMTLWGEQSEDGKMTPDQNDHGEYAHHICAEIEIEEEYKGVMRRRWQPKNKANDWLDASYMGCVAAAMKGVRIGSMGSRPSPTNRPSAQDLARKARGA